MKPCEEKSLQFLAQIDQIDVALEGAGEDKELRRRLERNRKETCQEFALHLSGGNKGDDARGFVHRFHNRGRTIVAGWLVEGQPAKKYFGEAKAWMTEIGAEWDESAPALRKAVLRHLNYGYTPPCNGFGLHIEWTITIEGNGPRTGEPTWLERKMSELQRA